jgi:phosphohistidine phosphatase
MLRRLLLMRHAKSSPAGAGVSDHERPLEEKGSNDAHAIGRELHRRGFTPGLVLCSDSLRTRQTWAQVSEYFNVPYVESARLYESGLSAYRQVISGQDFDGECLMVIGHSPTVQEFVALYAGKMVDFKPACVAVLEVQAASFREALTRPGDWKLVEFITC